MALSHFKLKVPAHFLKNFLFYLTAHKVRKILLERNRKGRRCKEAAGLQCILPFTLTMQREVGLGLARKKVL